MRFLVDTQLLLWASKMVDRAAIMASEAGQLIGAPDSISYFSAASVWEVAIKSGLGRPDFAVDPTAFRDGLLHGGYIELPVTSDHAVAVRHLPPIHRDPFDRLLVAQAAAEGLELLTADAALARYPGPIRLVR